MKKFIIILVTVLFCVSGIYGQSGMAEHNWKFSFEPQYLIMNGLKLSIEKSLKTNRDWLVISPSVYYREYDASYVSENDFVYYNEIGLYTTRNIKQVKGLGLSIDNKLLLTEPIYSKWVGFHMAPYFTYGLTYNYFELTRLGEAWITVPRDGVPYMYQDIVQTKKEINKAGINLTLGLQTEIIEDILFDFYIGCGIRYSFYEGEIKYNKSSMDYGFKGVMLLGGFKIGVGLD